MSNTITVYDKYGTIQPWTWLEANFGNVLEVIEPNAMPDFWCDSLWEIDDLPQHAANWSKVRMEHHRTSEGKPLAPATLIVTVLGEDGAPLNGIQVVFYWPDAPPLPGGGHHEKGVVGTTNADGKVGFGMGPGAYYDPAKEQGPHQVWLYGPGMSTRIEGLGMIAGTNHRHLDVYFQLSTEPPPPPPDEVFERLDTIEQRANRIIREVAAIRALLGV